MRDIEKRCQVNMHRNRSSLRRLAAGQGLGLVIIFTMISGCGSEKPPPPPKKIIPPAVVPNPNMSPSTPTVARPAKPAKATEKAFQWPAGTDLNSVVEIAATNQPMEVGPRVQAENKFIVEAGQKGLDSTAWIVAAIERPQQNAAKAGFSLPAGFVPLPEFGNSPEGLPLRIRSEKAGSTLALVPGGLIHVGTNGGPSECQPEFAVQIDTFYMEIFEVTVTQFEDYRQDMKERKKPLPPPILNPNAPPRTPVLGVPWANAQLYARWANMDLPTEAEFEKAARGPKSLRTPWGNGRPIWPKIRTPETLTTIGAYEGDVSPYGIYDLAGNALEWCNDLYSDHAHRDAVGTNGQVPHNWPGPKKTSTANMRVVKGNGPDWSAWHRQGHEVGKGYPNIGFRCVLRLSNADN